MRRVTLFLSRFTLGLLIVFICTFAWFIIRVSPGVIDTDIAGVAIALHSETPVRFSGYDFSCDKKGGNSLTECQAVIENSLLELAVTYTDTSKSNPESPIGCKASYADKVIACRAGLDFESQEAPFPTYVGIKSDLGISQQRLQQLRRQNWVTNNSEDDWKRLANLVAVAIGAMTTIWLWQYISRQANHHESSLFMLYQPINVDNYKILICLTSGVVVFGLSGVFFFLSLLGFGYID